MNTQNAIIGGVVLIVLAVGGYSIYRATSNGDGAANVAGAGLTATSTDPATTVQGQDVRVGTGREAKPGDLVSVLYAGKFTDGTVFDSSAAHDNEPLKFILGADGLIPGFQVGVNGMKEGGQRLISVPPTLGYGAEDVKDDAGNVVIPANSTLVFEVELVKVEDAPTAAPETTPEE
ncbi:peptidylprolyl isomerase [Candidatus Kaiserbacteria bacterium CG10_big_fil_rev_8_21_14_0_10_51_14]|uniref:Peptidyl-prolyl cis-trans isomerase n=1 Tax=Candidatus Kaiserbacteria bacterium CG10_big_fil_rev_8_21_14_0_10_51_14 TaxID=1974610 RepID=A0A2H0UCS7_9BACT|nr:MAG: peptidylprolyl isomerase [Candidatus Kaiserbacteria bacterium CG10_big_fil_rev_8_21_14_0_10_51_14]